MLEFRSEVITLKVLDSSGKPIEYKMERRLDPLTSRASLICPHLKEKWAAYYGKREDQWLRQIVEDSKHGCPFCSPTIDRVTARFPEELVPGGIFKFQNVYVFPNLFPRTEFEAVVTSPHTHYLALTEFTAELLHRFLTSGLECIRRVYGLNNALTYPVIGTNYLPPAGASLIHFHQQIAIQRVPFNRIGNLISHSSSYASTQDGSFFPDFIKINCEREIKQLGDVYWYVPFAPAGFREVRAMVNKSNFLEFAEEDIRDIAAGLSNVLRYYGESGFDSFNCVLYSGSLGNIDSFRAGLSIVARPTVRPNYLSIDSWYMPFLLDETVVSDSPEDLTAEIRKYF